MSNETIEQEKQRLKEFLNDNRDASEKLDSLLATIESIEDEYKLREKHRLNDLQLVLNNAYTSKGVLKHTEDYKRQLLIAIKDVSNQIDGMDKQINQFSSDIIVYEKRYNDFRNNVVTQADECLWEMDKLFELLESDNYDEDNEPRLSKEYDKSISDLTEFTDIGSLGLQLSLCKKSIDQRNSTLDILAAQFKQIRYAHAMQYHHNKEAYIFYRKTADLTGNDHEQQIYQQFSDQATSKSISRQSSADSGILLDLNED